MSRLRNASCRSRSPLSAHVGSCRCGPFCCAEISRLFIEDKPHCCYPCFAGGIGRRQPNAQGFAPAHYPTPKMPHRKRFYSASTSLSGAFVRNPPQPSIAEEASVPPAEPPSPSGPSSRAARRVNAKDAGHRAGPRAAACTARRRAAARSSSPKAPPPVRWSLRCSARRVPTPPAGAMPPRPGDS